MHQKFSRADELSNQVIGAAIEVHRHLGPGLMESVYQRCIIHELELHGLRTKQRVTVPIRYKDLQFEDTLRLDMLVEECLVVELKAVESVLPVHKAQLLSYMKLMDIPVGLLINFHEALLKDGVSRLILPGANTT